jgi:hypothetical protein
MMAAAGSGGASVWPGLSGFLALRALRQRVGAVRPYPMIDSHNGARPNRHEQEDGD